MLGCKSWHYHRFSKGELGPLGSRGKPGKDGLKGAKVRESCSGGILVELWLSSFLRMQQIFLLDLQCWSSFCAQTEPLITKPQFSRKFLFFFYNFFLHYKLPNSHQHEHSKSVSMSWEMVTSRNHSFTFSPLQGGQGLPGPRGHPGKPGAQGEYVCFCVF